MSGKKVALDPEAKGQHGWTVFALIAMGITAAVAAITAVHFPISNAISLDPGPDWGVPGGILFWTVATLALSNMWVRGPGGTRFDLSNVPVIAAALLGGPFAAVFVALVGTTTLQELRRRVPWYGTALTHAGAALTAAVATVLVAPWQVALRPGVSQPDLVASLVVAMTMALTMHVLQHLWSGFIVARRSTQGLKEILRPDPRFEVVHLASLPVGWLCAATYVLVGPWAGAILTVVFIAWLGAVDRETARRRAERDPMTGLLLRDALLRWHTRTSRAGSPPLTVFDLDLDGFVALNRRYGYDAGDEVLIEVARRIQAVVPAGAAVARTGGDEFVVATRTDDEPSALIEHLATAIAAPINCAGEVIHVSCSIGTSRADSPEADLDSLIRAAEAAMYEAKRSRVEGATTR